MKIIALKHLIVNTIFVSLQLYKLTIKFYNTNIINKRKFYYDKKIIPILVFLFSILLINSACQAKDIDNVTPGNAYLSEDSILTFKLLDNLDSNTAQKHDNIKFILLKDITVKNIVIIPQNTVLSATVTKAHGSRIFGQSGIIRLKLNNYKINNTYTIHFNNDLKFKGGRNYANVAASMIVPFSGLLFKGKEVNYPAGTVIEYKLDDNLDLGIKEEDLLAICTQ